MKVDIVIPTYKRINQLLSCIDSIKIARSNVFEHEIKLKIFVSTIKEYQILDNLRIINFWTDIILMGKKYIAPIFWNDYLKEMKSDAMVYINDDVELDKNCIKEGIKALKSLNLDGVIGFKQFNAKPNAIVCKGAFGMIGSKFADRFPKRQVFCPDYIAFGLDTELWKFSESIGRFIYCETALLKHYHPTFTGQNKDETYQHNRKIGRNYDTQIRNLRGERGLLWGKTFERVNHLIKEN